MAIYRYTSGSLIDEVTVLTNETGGKRAYLHGASASSSADLRKAKINLRAEGYVCIPALYEGKPALEVRGFKKNEELILALDKQGMTTGTPAITPDIENEQSRKQQIQNRSLQFAGFSYNIGDASYLYYKGAPLIKEWHAFPKGEKFGGKFFGLLDVIAGVGYGVGSMCLTFFGAHDQSVNTITDATQKVERYARKEGIEITPESSIAYVNTAPDRGMWEKLKATVARYPSEAMNSIYVFVGLFLSSAALYHATKKIDLTLPADALKKAQKSQLWDRIDVGLGAVTATSGIIGLTVKERKRMEGDPERSGIGGAIDWVREKPLRTTGYGLMIATGFHAVATWGKWKDKAEPQKYLIGRVIFICTNIISEAMLTLSSKGHGIGVKPDSSIDQSIAATTAELIARQPEDKRDAMIEQMAGYIASPEVSATNAAATAKLLRDNVKSLGENPWTSHFKSADEATAAKQKPDTFVNSATAIERIDESHKQAALA